MHKIVVLTERVANFAATHDLSLQFCLESLEAIARRKSPVNQYVLTVSNQYSPGYRKAVFKRNLVLVGKHTFITIRQQREWLSDLSTLQILPSAYPYIFWLKGHFYAKVTPFK